MSQVAYAPKQKCYVSSGYGSDKAKQNIIAGPRQVGRTVTAEPEDRMAVVAVMAFKRMLAGDHMLIQLVDKWVSRIVPP